MQGFLNFRETAKAKQSDIVKANEIHDKDLYMTFDGGKQGNHSAMIQSFTSTATVVSEAESLVRQAGSSRVFEFNLLLWRKLLSRTPSPKQSIRVVRKEQQAGRLWFQSRVFEPTAVAECSGGVGCFVLVCPIFLVLCIHWGRSFPQH